MNPELQRELENLPADDPRSRLEPYRELILRWRRQGRTYRRICALLAEQCNVTMNCGALCRYVERRSRPRKLQPELESEHLAFASVEQSPRSSTGKLTPEERAAQVEYIRSLNKPELQEQPAKPRWNFDADKPRTMHKP